MEKICMIIDTSVLKNMIENDNNTKAVEMLNLLKSMNEKSEDKNPWIVTTQSSLLRALYLADKDKFNLQNLQKIISCVTVAPSFANFRDNEMVTNELIIFAKGVSEREKE